MSTHQEILIEDTISEENNEEEEVQSPKGRLLTEDAIHFQNDRNHFQKSRDFVPPGTPNSLFSFETTFSKLPPRFRSLDSLEIPDVQDTGVKFCIDTLGNYFGLTNYKFDFLQFWILDTMTDCIWISQDEFRFPKELQKIVLAWVLYFLDILRDPTRNLSRNKFFTIFKEAILIASEVVAEGCDTVPIPEKLFEFVNEDQESARSWNSTSSSSYSSLEINEVDSVTFIKTQIDPKYYELPKEPCRCFAYDQSSLNTTQEVSSLDISQASSINCSKEDFELELDIEKLYKPDFGIPTRFLPLPEESVEEESEVDVISICEKPDKDAEDVYEVLDKHKITTATVFSKSSSLSDSVEVVDLPSISSFQKELTFSQKKEKVLEELSTQKLWEQRLKDMNNPRKGWVPYDKLEGSSVEEETDDKGIESSDDEMEWIQCYLDSHKENIRKMEDQQMVNFGVLWAIIDYIIKNFYESFQFWLIRLAFQATPNIITQQLNKDWKIPKQMKCEFERPKYVKEKVKKETITKGAKATGSKEKDDKKNKKDTKDKKDKDSKKIKTDQKEKSKKDKASAKPKVGKPAKPTKEEIEEQARLRNEQILLEEQQRILEENRKFMFPLGDAATDELFQSMFENWVHVESHKKDEIKGKKGKK